MALPRVFLAVLFVFLASLPPALAGGAVDGTPLSPDQQALLDEFFSLRPETAESGGVWMLAEWDSDAGLERLVEYPVKSGNAAAHFKRVDELYRANLGRPDPAAKETGIGELLQASELAECRFSPDFYPEFDRSDSPQPDFVALRSCLQSLLASADSQERRLANPREAERRYRAALLCGRHLTRDRSSLVVYMTGVIFKLRAAQAYEAFLRRQGRMDDTDAAKAYAERIAELLRLFYWKANRALGTLEDFTSLPVALEVALLDYEPCWRAEAVIRLGIFRHGAPNQTLQEIRRDPLWEKEAEQGLIEAAAGDPAPALRRLAAWTVVNVTPEMFSNMQHLFK